MQNFHKSIYLNRHWPERLSIDEAIKLPTKRLLAYYRKHYHKIKWFSTSYPEHLKHKNDNDYNGEFGTSPNMEFQDYFNQLKAELNKRENV
jgi:hypothetical protein